MPQKIIKPLDGIVIAIVAALGLAAALLVFAAGQSTSAEASVLYDGGVIEIPLSHDRVFEVKSSGYTLGITVAGGEIYISEADCPDRFCVDQGKITRRGQSIVCLPAHVLIEIKGGDYNAGEIEFDTDECDAIAG